MLFRQLFDHGSSTYTYLLADELTRARRLRELTGAKTVSSRSGAPCADVAVFQNGNVPVPVQGREREHHEDAEARRAAAS